MDSLLFNSINFLFSFLAFISNVVRINGYKLLKQKFFGVFDNFSSIRVLRTHNGNRIVSSINDVGRTSLVVQWLRLHTSNAGDAGLIPGWETRIPFATWCSEKKKKALGILDIHVQRNEIKRLPHTIHF